MASNNQKTDIFSATKLAWTYAALLCITCIVLKAALHPVLIMGSSMYPTYYPGDIVTYTEAEEDTQYNRGTVVVFYSGAVGKSSTYIKRIAAIEGDEVRIEGGTLYINDVPETGRFYEEEIPLTEIGPGMVYVLGDNTENSYDSRSFGPIGIEKIKGIINDETVYRIPSKMNRSS